MINDISSNGLSVSVSARPCPSPYAPDVPAPLPLTTDYEFTYMDTEILECPEKNLRFPDGRHWVKSRCAASGQWSVDIQDCSGIHSYLPFDLLFKFTRVQVTQKLELILFFRGLWTVTLCWKCHSCFHQCVFCDILVFPWSPISWWTSKLFNWMHWSKVAGFECNCLPRFVKANSHRDRPYLCMSLITPEWFISVLTCPPIPHVGESIVNTSIATYGTFVLYKCKPGHHFPSNNETEAVITCEDNALWSEKVEDCQGLSS